MVNGVVTAITLTNPGTGYTAPVVTITDVAGGLGVDALAAATIDGAALATLDGTPNTRPFGIRKFIDTLPGLGPANANNLGQYISVATPDTITYPGSDYYEIGLQEYSEKMHSDLPPTKLRGYVQLNKGTDTDPASPTFNQNTVVPVADSLSRTAHHCAEGSSGTS